MEPFTLRMPEEQKDEVDGFVENSDEWENRSAFIRDAVSHLLSTRDGGSLAGRLREAAETIDAVADVAPAVDYDEATIEEYEAEFGEVPEHGEILREIAQVTRHAAINIEVHEDDD